MAHVKGCDISLLPEKKVRQADFAEGFEAAVPVEQLRAEILALHRPFTDAEGRLKKYTPSGLAYGLYKKIDKKKRLIAVALIRRVARKKEKAKGLNALFSNSNDQYVLEHFYQLPGFEEEAAWFDEAVLGDMRQAVGYGQVKEVLWGDRLVQRAEKKKIGAHYVSAGTFFVAMLVVWGLVFDNFGVGLCYALLFMSSFTMITSRTKAETVKKEDGEISSAAPQEDEPPCR